MSISNSLSAMKAAKTDISAAITAKGGIVNEGDGFSDFAADIATISTGDMFYGGIKVNFGGLFPQYFFGTVTE